MSQIRTPEGNGGLRTQIIGLNGVDPYKGAVEAFQSIYTATTSNPGERGHFFQARGARGVVRNKERVAVVGEGHFRDFCISLSAIVLAGYRTIDIFMT